MAGPGGQEVGRVSVRVLPNTDDFRRRLREELEQATAGLSAHVGVDVDLDTAGVRARMRALLTELRAQAAGGVDINVGVDRRNGVAGLIQSFRGLGSGASGASGSVGGLTSNLVLCVAVLALLGPLVTLVGGLLAGLPSLLIGFGAAAGVVALGFDGIKRAASSLGAPLAALKESLSATFERRLTPQFQQLAEFLPSLRYGLTDVANGLADMSQGFLDSITSASGFTQITGILRDTGKLLSNLKPFAGSMTDAFLQLASSGAGAFSYLSGSLNRFGAIFETTVNNLADDGSLDRAMKGLSGVFDGLGDGFNFIFDAAVRTIPALGRQMKVTLRELGIGIADALPGLTAFGSILLASFAAVGRALGSFLKGAGPALTRFADALTNTFAKGSEGLSGFAERAGAKFGEFVDWLRERIPEIVRSVGDFFKAISGEDTGNESNGTVIGSSIREFFTWISDFWAQHGEQIKTGISGITGAIIGAGPVIASIVSSFIDLGTFVGNAKDKFVEFRDTVAQFVTDTVSPIVRGIGNSFNYVKTKVTEAHDAIVGFASNAVAALQSAGSQILSAVTSAWNAVVSTIRTKVGEAVTAAGELGGKIKSALSGLVGDMRTIGGQIIQGLIDGIKGMAESVASAAKSVVQGAIDAAKSALKIGSPSKVFNQFGVWSATGYINGLNGEGSNVDKAGDKFGDRVAASLKKQVPTIDQAWADAMKQSNLGDLPKNFLEATGNDLLSDIGLSTDGALGNLVKQVTEVHNSPTYYVSDLDEAMRKEKSRQTKASLQYTRR